MAQGINVAKALQQQQAAAQTVVAKVQVVMTADGNVSATCEVPNRQVLLMMLETAKLDLNALYVERTKKAAEPQIEVPGGGGILIAQPG
jgi:phosphopantothenate synthetase